MQGRCSATFLQSRGTAAGWWRTCGRSPAPGGRRFESARGRHSPVCPDVSWSAQRRKAKLNNDRPSSSMDTEIGAPRKNERNLYCVSIELVKAVTHRKAVTIADRNTAPEINPKPSAQRRNPNLRGTWRRPASYVWRVTPTQQILRGARYGLPIGRLGSVSPAAVS